MKKDNLQIWIESECKIQFWAKNMIAKNKKEVKEVNRMSISSIKQTLKK